MLFLLPLLLQCSVNSRGHTQKKGALPWLHPCWVWCCLFWFEFVFWTFCLAYKTLFCISFMLATWRPNELFRFRFHKAAACIANTAQPLTFNAKLNTSIDRNARFASIQCTYTFNRWRCCCVDSNTRAIVFISFPFLLHFLMQSLHMYCVLRYVMVVGWVKKSFYICHKQWTIMNGFSPIATDQAM